MLNASTEVDDGECTHAIAVSPIGQFVYGALGEGTFECVYSCAGASGVNLLIDYE